METIIGLQAAWFAYLKQRKEVRMERSEMVKKLRSFREEFGDFFLSADAPVALVLRDICHILDFSRQECEEVLGREVAEAIENWETSRQWQLVEETATEPVTGQVAASQ